MAKITARFRAYLKTIGVPVADIMHPLAGIQELRKVVAWANATTESAHDFKTPAELIAAYRKAVRS